MGFHMMNLLRRFRWCFPYRFYGYECPDGQRSIIRRNPVRDDMSVEDISVHIDPIPSSYDLPYKVQHYPSGWRRRRISVGLL
jgi:hypothetical protein